MAEAESQQSDYRTLLSENFSPAEAKEALERFPDEIDSAREWLNSGGCDISLHGRVRTESTWDPTLASNLYDSEMVLRNDLSGDLSNADTTGEDMFVKLATQDEIESNVRELAEHAFQEYSGILEKQSPSSFAGWQKRWFYLWENKLTYFKEGTPIQKGMIDLNEVSKVTICGGNTRKFIIEVNNSEKTRKYELKGPDEDTVQHWRTLILANKLRAAKMGVTPPAESFDKSIHLKNLPLLANTGDILLFCSENAGGYIVQSATGGDFDHIGILIRHAPNQVCVLEALGKHGVQLYKWEDFIKEKWYTQYKSIALRRLHISNRSLRKQVVVKIVNFVKEVVNCEYSWTPMKMMRRQSTSDQALKDRTYFCSELVAKAYKLSGLLREDCSSGCYTPAMFEEKFNLHLLKGAKLLSEQTINFDTK